MRRSTIKQNQQKAIRRGFMKKLRTAVSVLLMAVAGLAGFFIGASMNQSFGGAILCSMIAGIACIVYTIDNPEE
jgi:hypothetical protein